jgi:hypothetical protein
MRPFLVYILCVVVVCCGVGIVVFGVGIVVVMLILRNSNVIKAKDANNTTKKFLDSMIIRLPSKPSASIPRVVNLSKVRHVTH